MPILKTEKPQLKNLILFLKLLEKQEQAESKIAEGKK
jgi:hypothetical protein